MDTPYPEVLQTNSALQKQALLPLKEVQCHLPFKIGDYTDFFVGLHHAYSCGVMFRGPANALNPNYKHLPVGYHGRASSIVVSGTPIRRPNGQFLENPGVETKKPIFAPIRKLDYELELAAFVCRPNKQGEPVSVNSAEENLFGLVMMNDWSARDVQSWEYIPLGPFNSKNFGTTVSAWVVLMDALEPFRAQGIENDQDILPYLKQNEKNTVYDIKLQIELKSKCLPTSLCFVLTAGSQIWKHLYRRNFERSALALVVSTDGSAPHIDRLQSATRRLARLWYNKWHGCLRAWVSVGTD